MILPVGAYTLRHPAIEADQILGKPDLLPDLIALQQNNPTQ